MIYRQIAAFLALLFVLIPASHGREYKIATVAWIGWSPLHVALEKGFWAELGLEVDVINYDDPIVILEAIKAQKIDFAMDMAGSLVGVYMNGEPVVAIAETNWSHGGDKIIVRKGHELADYKNEALGVFLKQPSCLYFLGQYLNRVGLILSDFRIVEINTRDLSAQFAAGRLPAIVNYEPWASEALENGNGEVLATSADFTGCIPECLWGYRQTIAGIPDDHIHKILKGWIKAVQWLKNPANRKAYYKILKEKTFPSNIGMTDEDLSDMLKAVSIHSIRALKERNRDSGGLFNYFIVLRAFLMRNDMLQKDFSPADIFDNRYIMRVVQNE